MNILLLEDDVDLGQAVAEHLETGRHEVHWCKLIAQVQGEDRYDIALLDLNLPDGDALSLIRAWRAAGRKLPVIVLTARDQVSDRIRGLQAGADDYLVKPFDLNELGARIEAVARRTNPSSRLAVGDIALDLSARCAWRGPERIDLTAMEWGVLSALARHPGRIYSRAEIGQHLAADGGAEPDSNSLEVIVSRLRKKIGAGAISTHRGLGYRLDA